MVKALKLKMGILTCTNGRGPIQGNISSYPGSWPKVVINYLRKNGYMTGAILEPFSGRSNLNTFKIDINIKLNPDIIGAAQKLPFRNGAFDCAILDPPYNNMYSESLYSIKAPDLKLCIKEAARCVKDKGFVSVLCFKNMPSFKELIPIEKIFVNLGPDRHIRCLNIYRIKREQIMKIDSF